MSNLQGRKNNLIFFAKHLRSVRQVYTFTLMEHTTMHIIKYSEKERSYFCLDYDDALAFCCMYDGDFEYTDNGYYCITI